MSAPAERLQYQLDHEATAGAVVVPVKDAREIVAALRTLEVDAGSVPPLAGAADVAELLKVSRQRVHQLSAEHPDFPTPVARIAAGPVWTVAAIEAFGQAWDRRAGRRPRTASAS